MGHGLIGGAATAFVESTLAQLYKVRDKGAFRGGGPAYYMQYGLGKRWMGMVFAVIITVTYGFVFNAVQTNSIVDAVASSAGEKTTVLQVGIGAVVAVLVAAVIFGGGAPHLECVAGGGSGYGRCLSDHRDHRGDPQHRGGARHVPPCVRECVRSS